MSAKIGYGLVRDKNGKPKIDDPSKLHPSVVTLLTEQEREELGLWSGPQARDAQGFKRLERIDGGFRALEDLVAVSEIYDGGNHYRVSPRIDIPTGNELKLET